MKDDQQLSRAQRISRDGWAAIYPERIGESPWRWQGRRVKKRTGRRSRSGSAVMTGRRGNRRARR